MFVGGDMQNVWNVTRRGAWIVVAAFVACQPAGTDDVISPSAQTAAVAITPGTTSVPTTGTVAFSAQVTGTVNTGVDWSISEGAQGGTLTPNGAQGVVYGAPATPGTYHVVVRSQADQQVSATATISVVRPGGVPRPSYNTGTGFFVANGKLYDANGVEFRIRGLNKLHWDIDWSPGIQNTHANTVRWSFSFRYQTQASALADAQALVAAHLVPMLESQQITCGGNPADLLAMVDNWILWLQSPSTPKGLERYMFLNIANEWGPADSTVWRDTYITAVGRIRAAGWLGAIVIDSGGCGQDLNNLVKYAQAVFDSDPQKNIVFGIHIYGLWTTPGLPNYDRDVNSWGSHDLIPGFDQLAALGLPIIVGEFGPGRDIGPSPTPMTPGTIIQAAESHGFGWLAWAWDDPGSNADDNWFGMSINGTYNSSADLTTFGKDVVENPTYGLKALAQPATIW